MSENEIIIPDRHDLSMGRFYEHEGIMKPSATTVLQIIDKGKHYNEWIANFGGWQRIQEYIRAAAEKGTRVHLNAEGLINGLPVDLDGVDREEKLLLMAFVNWVNEVKPKFIASELTMWHPDYPVAGTADIICEIKGQLFLIDIKTGGSYDTHELQLTSYGRLYKLIYRREPALSVLRLRVVRNLPKYEPIRYGYMDKELEAAVALWNWRNPNLPKPPEGPKFELPKMIQLDKEFIYDKEPERSEN